MRKVDEAFAWLKPLARSLSLIDQPDQSPRQFQGHARVVTRAMVHRFISSLH